MPETRESFVSAGLGMSKRVWEGLRGADGMRRSALCILVALLLCFAIMPKPALAQVQTPHYPISIINDNDFTPANGVNGGGSGTRSDPYIIENWVINTGTGAFGITIQGTTAYFVVRNCSASISLEYAANGTIENNSGEISLSFSSFVTVAGNTNTNIILSAGDYDNIIGNICSNSDYGIDLEGVTNSIISNNVCNNNYTYRGYISYAPPCNCGGAGIYLEMGGYWGDTPCEYDLISNNTCESNGSGILSSYGDNNIISNNTCKNNYSAVYVGNEDEAGICLLQSSGNVLDNNTCGNDHYGIYLDKSPNNIITHNYLLNNTENNAQDSPNNINNWDNNYWSDWQPPQYPENGNTGIISVQRPIAGGPNWDFYPLVLSAAITATTTTAPTTTTATTTSPTTTTTTPPTTTTTSAPSSESLPYWILLVVVVLVLLVGSIAYLVGRRVGRRPSAAKAPPKGHAKESWDCRGDVEQTELVAEHG
jgi:parallel beta-helix repeat protein